MTKKNLHLSGIVNFCDCNSIGKTIDFYRKYRNFKSIFHAKTAERKRSLGDLGRNIGQNSWEVLSTFVQDSQLFEWNVIQKILDFYLKYSNFREFFLEKLQKNYLSKVPRRKSRSKFRFFFQTLISLINYVQF